MLRSFWLILSTLAVANVLALLGVAGWLKMTDRLSAERVEEVRAMFAVTVSDAEKEAMETLAEENNPSLEERLAEGEGTAPLMAPAMNRMAHEQDEISRQRVARAQREQEDLLRTATLRLRELESRERDFEERVAAWEAMRKRLTAQESDEQFRKAVQTYEAQKPDVSREMLGTLIDRGETDRVVAYLNAMQPRKSAKVVDSFAQEDPALAAGLLERLRTFGIETPEPTRSTDDNADQPNLAANP